MTLLGRTNTKDPRDAEALLSADKFVGELLQSLEISEANPNRWRT